MAEHVQSMCRWAEELRERKRGATPTDAFFEPHVRPRGRSPPPRARPDRKDIGIAPPHLSNRRPDYCGFARDDPLYFSYIATRTAKAMARDAQRAGRAARRAAAAAYVAAAEARLAGEDENAGPLRLRGGAGKLEGTALDSQSGSESGSEGRPTAPAVEPRDPLGLPLIAISNSNALAPFGSGGPRLDRLRARVLEHGPPPPYNFAAHEASFRGGQFKLHAEAWRALLRSVSSSLPQRVNLILSKGLQFALRDAARFDPREPWDRSQAITPDDVPAFEEEPRPSCFQSPEHEIFVSAEIRKMEAMGAVKRLLPGARPRHVSALHVVGKKGADKFRLCLDATRINQYIHLRTFRYQTLDQVLELLRRFPNCWFVSYDMRKGYYHVALGLKTACILAFKWTMDRATAYYVYEALPFGVAVACYVFTKIMRTFAKYWFALASIILCTFIDDGLFLCESEEEAILVSQHLQHVAARLGITFSDKSDFVPSQQRVYLGLGLDAAAGVCYLPEKKRTKILAVLQPLRGASEAPAVELQRIAGSLNAARLAFVGAALVARPLTAAIAQASAAGGDPQAVVPLGPLQQRVISWLLDYLPVAPPAPIWRPSRSFRLYTDASGWGYCAALDIEPTSEPLSLAHREFRSVFGRWDPEIANEDNCWRELRAVVIAANSLFRYLPPGSHVVARVDNNSAVAAALKGSVVDGMMDLALRLFAACVERRVTIETVHIRGTDNGIADAGSRERAPSLNSGLLRRLSALQSPRSSRRGPGLPHVHVWDAHGPPFVGDLPSGGAIVTVDWRLRPRFLNWLVEHDRSRAQSCVWLIQRPSSVGAPEWLPLLDAARARGWFLSPLPQDWHPRHLFYSSKANGSVGLGRSPWPLWVCAPLPSPSLIAALAAQEPRTSAGNALRPSPSPPRSAWLQPRAQSLPSDSLSDSRSPAASDPLTSAAPGQSPPLPLPLSPNPWAPAGRPLSPNPRPGASKRARRV